MINIKPSTCFTGDNLPILRNINSNSVDLIYLDPPFNSNKSFSAPIGSKAAGASFKDAWTLSDVDQVEHRLLKEGGVVQRNLYHSILAAKHSHSDSMFSYLMFMSVRLIECHRILKDTGSLYLHCDPFADSYLRIILDTIFGRHNFRNQIIWGYAPTGRGPKLAFHQKHDVIFYYGKTDAGLFNRQYTEMTEATLSSYSSIDEQGRRFSKAHGKKTYLDQIKGRPVPSWWTDIGAGSHMPHKERTGYPTQKPLKLLERIIKASSNQGDIVLDPFCGCATTMVAANRLQRKWIGIDLSDQAVRLVTDRIREDGGLFGKIIPRDDIPKRTDLGDELTTKGKMAYKHKLYGKQSGYCAGCQAHYQAKDLEIDHIIPRSHGGTDHKANFQLLCGNCNRKKGAKSQAEFVKELKGV